MKTKQLQRSSKQKNSVQENQDKKERESFKV